MKLVIATPTRGRPETAQVAWLYTFRVRELERRLVGAELLPADELPFSYDVIRTRSIVARVAVQRGADWILWWDDDVLVDDVGIVPRMLERAIADGHDWIGAPYPCKHLPHEFPYIPLPEDLEAGRLPIKNDCIEVAALALGFTLMSRRCVEAMIAHYREELWFTQPGHDVEDVAIFDRYFEQPRVHEGKRYRGMLSEDNGACYRWRDMGGKVQMYVGAGVPLGHLGAFAYRGAPEEIANFGHPRKAS